MKSQGKGIVLGEVKSFPSWEREIEHMHLGKWKDLFKEFRKMHNYKMKRLIFEDEKKWLLLWSYKHNYVIINP